MVEAVLSGGADEALREGVRSWRANGREDDLDADRREHGVEAGRELRISIADEETHLASGLFELRCEIASDLGHPQTVGVGGHAEQVDDAPFELDDEQHVITAEQNGVDREEISGQEAFGLGAEELAPAGPNSPGRGSKAVTAEDTGDAGFRDIDAKLSKFPDDAEVAPAGVLTSLSGQSWVSLWITRGGNVSAVPAISALEETDPFFLSADLGRDSFQAAAQLVDLHGETGERARPPASRPVLLDKSSKVGSAIEGGPARPCPGGDLLEADRLARRGELLTGALHGRDVVVLSRHRRWRSGRRCAR